MIKKKICMLGGFAVGKTSLVQRFVRRIFSEKYLTTIGVRIDRKSVMIGTEEVDLLIWDIHGEDNMQAVAPAYLRGSAGYLLVVDGTRRETLGVAREIDDRIIGMLGPLPAALLLNKSDLAGDWEISDADVQRVKNPAWHVFKTSAKTGAGVEDCFADLAGRLIGTSGG